MILTALIQVKNSWKRQNWPLQNNKNKSSPWRDYDNTSSSNNNNNNVSYIHNEMPATNKYCGAMLKSMSATKITNVQKHIFTNLQHKSRLNLCVRSYIYIKRLMNKNKNKNDNSKCQRHGCNMDIKPVSWV